VQELVNAVVEAAKAAIDAAKGVLGIESPSKVFAGIGRQMMAGWAAGITGNPLPQQAVMSAAGGTVSAATSYGGRGGGGVTLIYSPAVALGDRYEAESVLAPMIERALRKVV
jgi:hypothetical protein